MNALRLSSDGNPASGAVVVPFTRFPTMDESPTSARLTQPCCAVWTRQRPEAWRFVVEVAAAMGIRCEFRDRGDLAGADAAITDEPGAADLLASLRVPTLVICRPAGVRASGSRRLVRFNANAHVAWPFHGTSHLATIPDAEPELPLAASDEIVAWHGRTPLWVVRPRHGVRHHIAQMAFDPADRAETLCHACRGDEFFAALPLLFLFRETLRTWGWEPPPLRACFMFDDPNLHAPAYGYVDYRKIIEAAKEATFHVAFATIPLDCYFSHPGAAGLFRQHPEFVSLLVHGNDHTYCELAQHRFDRERHARLVGTALRRIRHLESRTGLTVARVMAAPHGACSEQMLGALATGGFEGACISAWSLQDHNPGAPWTHGVGLAPTEWISGLPVIPRFRFRPECDVPIRLAALLDQPIVPFGHHADVAEGAAVLSRIADTINSLGPVQWTDMQAMARTNFWVRRQGPDYFIRAYSRTIEAPLPPGVRSIRVDLPVDGNGRSVHGPVTCFRQTDAGSLAFSPGESFPADSAQRVAIRILAPDGATVRTGRHTLPPWPIARRIASETRDRVAPMMERIRRLKAGSHGGPRG